MDEKDTGNGGERTSQLLTGLLSQGPWQMPDLSCGSAVLRTSGADSKVPTRLGLGPLHPSEPEPLLVDLRARHKLVLRGLGTGVPRHQPQVLLGHESDHVRSVHGAQVVALLVQHLNDALVNFSSNVMKSCFILFFLFSLVLGVFSTKSFCVNEAGRSWGRGNVGWFRQRRLLYDVFTQTSSNASIFRFYSL